MIRPIVLTRKNSLFASHYDVAQNETVMGSLIQTCGLHGVDAQAYLTDISEAARQPLATLPDR
jgi:hypothetical protein